MISPQALMAEIHALDSKIHVLAQRMMIIEKNEQVISKTIISHNHLLKTLEQNVGQFHAGAESSEKEEEAGLVKSVESLSNDVKSMKDALGELAKEVGYLGRNVDSLKAQVNEAKYVLESVNPLEYVKINDVGDLVEDKIKQVLKKQKD